MIVFPYVYRGFKMAKTATKMLTLANIVDIFHGLDNFLKLLKIIHFGSKALFSSNLPAAALR